MRRPLIAFSILAGLGACHQAPKTVGGVNPDDAAALNNAADMLDTSADDLTAPSNGAMNAAEDDGNDAGNAE